VDNIATMWATVWTYHVFRSTVQAVSWTSGGVNREVHGCIHVHTTVDMCQ